MKGAIADGSLPAERFASYRKLLRELRALEVRKNARLRSEARKDMRRFQKEFAQQFPFVTIALQVLVSGLAAGGVYGLFAAGHSLVYRLTGIVHFAFGDLVGLGIFATLLVLAGTSPVTQSGAHEPRFLGALVVGSRPLCRRRHGRRTSGSSSRISPAARRSAGSPAQPRSPSRSGR